MELSMSLPPEFYDEDGNFNLKDFPRAVQVCGAWWSPV